jgi:hypothetical protein
LESTPKDEIARQEAMYEFVYSEEDYNKDLNVLHEVSSVPGSNVLDESNMLKS